MNYEKYSYGAYNLHIINTNKFKTIKVTVNFRTKSLENEITIRNILKIKKKSGILRFMHSGARNEKFSLYNLSVFVLTP